MSLKISLFQFLSYIKILITHHSVNTLLSNIFDTQNRENLTATFGTASIFIFVFTFALPIALYAITMLLAKNFKTKKAKRKGKRYAPPEDLNFVRQNPPAAEISEPVADQPQERIAEKEAKRKLKSLDAKIKVALAVSNKHLRLKGEYNAYLLGLYYEDPQVLIDRYMPEGHPLNAQTVEAWKKVDKNDDKAIIDFIDEYIVRNIAFLILLL
jgi:hypothetical protein